MRRSLRTLGSLLAIAGALGACTYTSRAIDPPDAQEIESSTLYAADGTLVHTFHAEENRKVVPLEQIPAHVREAVIAIEDERFYRHNGVDPRAILRAARTNVEAGATEQGGSTITQQYVKQEILKDDSPTFERKLQEASTAIQLERRYSKDRILELYLNAIYFGNGAYGIEAAAHQYFGKPAADLNLAARARSSPGSSSGRAPPTPTTTPRPPSSAATLVLERMLANDMITDDGGAAAPGSQPLQLASGVVPGRRALPGGLLRRGGEAVDPRRPAVRRHAAGAPRPPLRRRAAHPDHRRPRDAGAGRGGRRRDPARPERPRRLARRRSRPPPATCGRWSAGATSSAPAAIAKLNLATQGPRQAGSSFKPLVLATALTQGIDPLTRISAPVLHHHPDGRGRQAVAARATTAAAAAAPSPSPRARCGRTTRSTPSW